MRNPSDIIDEVRKSNSRIYKENIILREIEAKNDVFFTGLNLALNKLITFGIKKIPEKEFTWECQNLKRLTSLEFYDNIKLLETRQLTGNAAKDFVNSLMEKSSAHDWNNWYRLILLKDIKCGINEKTVNNCIKKSKEYKYEIPTFSCQLATDSNLHQSKMVGPKILQEKLDGTRVISIVYPDGRVDQFARNGKELLNFTEIKETFRKYISKTLTEPMVFDGEMMSDSFQAIMTQLYRKNNIETKDAVLYLFDMVPLEDFKKGYYSKHLYDRITSLSLKITDLDNIKLLDHKFINLYNEDDKKELDLFFKTCLEMGREGIMIKDPFSAYECKRTRTWLKLKPVFKNSFDLIIEDCIEGDGKYKGMLGALLCSGIDNGKTIRTKVGSGFSDDLRKLYWEKRIKIKGMVAEIMYDTITQNKDGGYSLRFPRFGRIRGFEKGEKL